jgi:hypothetical protein
VHNWPPAELSDFKKKVGLQAASVAYGELIEALS